MRHSWRPRSRFAVSQGAIVGGLNSWRRKRRAAGNAPTAAWSIPRCAAPPTSSTKTSNARAARPKTAIGEHAILLSKTMAAIVFDNARQRGIIKRGLRPPSEESEGLASRRDGDREFGTPKKAGPPSLRGITCAIRTGASDLPRSVLSLVRVTGRLRSFLWRRVDRCRHRPPPHRVKGHQRAEGLPHRVSTIIRVQ
jgi:hypothetical protein